MALAAAALLADLRARHAELVKAREEHHGNVRRAQEYLADAEKKDYGLAAVLGELETWIARAEADGASAVVIQLDTPGGSLDATRRAAQQVSGAGFMALPLDVRHVTLSTGQIMAALGTLG